MKRITLAVGLMLMVMLSACNLGNSGAQGNSQGVISGAPVVRIAAPLPNATYLEGVSVNIQAAVSNAGADIDRIEISIDNAVAATLPKPNTAGTPTFSVAQTWTATGAGQHSIAVTAFRADGSSSAPATVNVTVVSQSTQATATPATSDANGNGSQATQGTSGDNGSQQVQPTAGPTATPAPPTETPPPAATNTPSKPQATFSQGVNLRSGPSTKFNPPVGSYATGQTADIIAKTTAGDWYKVQGTNGAGWVFAQYVTVSGDAAAIAIDNGPPIPADTPAFTATPVATAVPATTANLVLGSVGITPPLPLKCKRTVEFKIDIANLGQQATANGGTISIKDYFNGQEQGSTTGAFPAIDAGKTINVGSIFLTVNTNVETDHKLVITLNPDGAVPETTNADNSRELPYHLQAC
ncbi:MAG: SH3 domain-containing protein [Chloroflexota bacterium]